MSSDSFVGEGLNPTPYREMKEENERLRVLLRECRDHLLREFEAEKVHGGGLLLVLPVEILVGRYRQVDAIDAALKETP